MNTKIKICGLTRLCDIEAVNIAKPDYIGFIFAESSRRITPQTAKELRNALNAGIIPVGVFVNEPIENILKLVNDKIISVIQLHGTEDENYIKALRTFSNVQIIKAVSVQKKGDAQSRENSAADYLLLDHKTGGSGKTFDWDLTGKIEKPFFLAGGLNPENVAAAIKKVMPYAVDVSSGVETSPGKKSQEKIIKFIKEGRFENE